MTPFSFKSDAQYHKQQVLSGAGDQEDFVAMQQSQYQAQFFLEACDTPPPNNHLISYNPSDSAMMDWVDSAERGTAFARNVMRPYHNGIIPDYIRNRTDRYPTGGRASPLRKIESLQQQIDDPFTSSGRSAGFSSSSFDSDTTIRDSTERHYLADDDVEMAHDAWNSDNITLNPRPQQSHCPVYHFVEARQAWVPDVGPDNHFNNRFIHHGNQFVFTHNKRPSQSDPATTPSPKKHRTMVNQAIGNFRHGSPRKSKRKIRPVYQRTFDDEEVGDLTGRELARKFREDSSRWWKIVVNPTGRWD